jgi:hypothetical protein
VTVSYRPIWRDCPLIVPDCPVVVAPDCPLVVGCMLAPPLLLTRAEVPLRPTADWARAVPLLPRIEAVFALRMAEVDRTVDPALTAVPRSRTPLVTVRSPMSVRAYTPRERMPSRTPYVPYEPYA